MNSIKKYRPSLTAELINHMLILAKKELPMSTLSMALIGTLAPFSAKIANYAIAPASHFTPKESLEASLGVSNSKSYITETKEERWLYSYNLYKLNPENCTLLQIKEAHEYMYLNDLMTKEEVHNFETTPINTEG